ncbi:myosin-binding protein 3-like [Quillaja saponaria]|nr:myosin-binding protein 3-like [Quillaja saponaria]
MALKRFPDLMRLKDQSCNSNERLTIEETADNGVVKMEDEASCTSCSGTRLHNLVDQGSGYDDRGKRLMNLKRRSGVRRRRKATHEWGKFSPVFSSDSLQSNVTLLSCSLYTGSKMKEDEDNPNGKETDERTCYSYEFSGSCVDSKGLDKYSYSMENHISNDQEKMETVANKMTVIRMLEQALEEEKAAHTALCIELEKERAAAASAADEAMAMILRLQKEKASIEMETRQYLRMIEERFAYDEEEKFILQEMLIRRERENHFLEQKIEAYRMSFRGNEQSNCELSELLDVMGQRPSFSLDSPEDLCLIPQRIESTESLVNKADANFMGSRTFNGNENYLSYDGDELMKDREHKDQVNSNLHRSKLDTESVILDVHVIEDNIELKRDKNENISGPSFNTASDEPRDFHLACKKSGVQSSCSSSTLLSTSKAEIAPDSERTVVGLTRSVMSDSSSKTLPFDSGRRSLSADISERLNIDTEIEMLSERLRMLQDGKENLTFFTGCGESIKGQLKLLEEIANQLQEIKQLRDPMRGASLHPSSSKVMLKKRRCQSDSRETCESS